jgi:reverse gyrase
VLVYRHICLESNPPECSDDVLLSSTPAADPVDSVLQDFSEFFTQVTGFTLWALQRAWARRMVSGESFALIAPTGVGKSTLLQVYSVYRSSTGDSVLYIVPTRSLVEQVSERISSLSRGLGVEVYNTIAREARGVCVTTHMALFRSKELLRGRYFGLVVADDFDALLKKSSLMDLVLYTLGFRPEDVEVARRITKLKQEAYAVKHATPERFRDLLKELESLEEQLARSIASRRVGQLLIASATGRGKRERVKVLRELIGFEVGGIVDYLRNVREFSASLSSTRIADLVKTLGYGTLVFVSRDLGRGYLKRLAEELESCGVKVAVAHTTRALDKLRKGLVHVLLGVATYYGVLTRGIDEPKLIKSALFIGIPKFRVPLDAFLSKLPNVLYSFRSLYGTRTADPELSRAYESLARLSPSKLKLVDLCLRGLAQPPNDYFRTQLEFAAKLRDFVLGEVRTVLGNGKLVLGNVLVKPSGNSIVVDIPDIYTYIQASGRTSRLLGGRMTLGISVLLYEDRDLYEIFLKRLKNFFETSFEELNPGKLVEALEEASKSREVVGCGGGDTVSRIVPALIVVESPTKARTIARIFGGGGRRYVGDTVAYETVIPVDGVFYVATVVPSLGHVFDLAVDTGEHGVRLHKDGTVEPVYTTLKRCRECGHQFTDEVESCPKCGSTRIYNSLKTLSVLRKLAREASVVILATDADEEGEKIAYDLLVTLKPFARDVRRAEIREITRAGVITALRSMRSVDLRLVKQQVLRRVDDRLIGFGISGVLKERLGTANAGGGRVQTPVLYWILGRYSEYVANRGYVVRVELPYEGLTLRFYAKDRGEAEKLTKALSEGVTVTPLSEEVVTVNPRPPYTTDTALEELSRELRLPPGEVMRILQELYETGFITYHRTPSTRVSSYGIEVARTYLSSVGLAHLLAPRHWEEGGAHEAIRPTRPLEDIEAEALNLGVVLTRKHVSAYRMIFRRFIASQMTPSKVLFRSYSFRVGTLEQVVKLPVAVVEDGFTKVLPLRTYNLPTRTEVVLPKSVSVYRGSLKPLPTVADAVRMMREAGIGRPSTYAKAIENNRRHGYVVISKYRQNLIPTRRGFEAVNVIKAIAPELLTPRYTARLVRLMEGVDERVPYEVAILLPVANYVEMKLASLEVKNLGGSESSVGVVEGEVR